METKFAPTAAAAVFPACYGAAIKQLFAEAPLIMREE